jgi:hypothetical protein
LEQRAAIFVEAMVAIAIIGTLAFLIALLVRLPQGEQAAGRGPGQRAAQSPRWYEFTLALILLGAIAAFIIWLVSSGSQWVWGETIGDWRSDTRTIIFAAVMVALGVIGLVVSLAYTLAQLSGRSVPRQEIAAAAETPSAGAAAVPAPSALRLLGFLAFVVAIVLLCWIGLTSAEQYGLVAQLIYPASLGVTLVLLFDKTTRTWGVKPAAEAVREWLLGDLLAFLLVLAFLNLRSLAKPETYVSSFWDILNIVLFFAAFWLLDRSSARSRFLLGYGYLIVLPLLLLVWDSGQGVAGPASWWASMWPFLILSIVFFILEVVGLVASAGDRQVLPAVKDAVFVLIYAILLIVALRSAHA